MMDSPQGQMANTPPEKPPGEAGTPGHGGTRGSLNITDPALGSKWEHWSQSGRRDISRE